MKITKSVLKQIIKEEIQKVMEKSAFYEVPMQEVKELPREVVAKLKGKELNARLIERDILQIDAKEDGYIILLKLKGGSRQPRPTKIKIQDPTDRKWEKDPLRNPYTGAPYSRTIVKVGKFAIDYDNINYGRIERILLGQQ